MLCLRSGRGLLIAHEDGCDLRARGAAAGFEIVRLVVRKALDKAVGNGLIQGNAHDNGLDYLDPNGSATRAQTATIIMRYCQLIGA